VVDPKYTICYNSSIVNNKEQNMNGNEPILVAVNGKTRWTTHTAILEKRVFFFRKNLNQGIFNLYLKMMADERNTYARGGYNSYRIQISLIPLG
jgi:hypothetical protein